MPVQTLIQHRTSPTADWIAANPVLALGEIGVDSTLNKFKIGDGTSTWSILAYQGATGAPGTQGATGPTGPAGIGTQGAQGIQGATGPTGPTGSQGSAAAFTPSNSAPSNPVQGQLWMDSNTGRAYIYYGTAWIQIESAGPIGATGPTGPQPSLTATLNSQSGTSYSTISSDRDKLIQTTSSSAIAITIDDVLTAGQRIDIIQDGAGQVSFTAGTGVTLQSANNYTKLTTRYSAATIFCVSSGQYRIIGDLSA
jgi:hypothetical protein